MTNKTREILEEMMNQFRSNHNDERAAALEEVLNTNAPERLQSQWRKTDMYTYTCDNCKYKITTDIVKNYCPNCGADNREV